LNHAGRQGGSVHEQSDGIEDSESGTASLSGTPLSHHSDGSVKGTEDIVKNRASIKGKEAGMKCLKTL